MQVFQNIYTTRYTSTSMILHNREFKKREKRRKENAVKICAILTLTRKPFVKGVVAHLVPECVYIHVLVLHTCRDLSANI